MGEFQNVLKNLLSKLIFLGLVAELYFVRDGVKNEYALNYVVPIPSKIDDLYFTWQSLAKQQVVSIPSY